MLYCQRAFSYHRPELVSHWWSGMNRILYLDGVRGLAIVLLMVGHFLTTRGVNFGRLGVELFFVLSGRLMAEILFVDRCEIGDVAPQ